MSTFNETITLTNVPDKARVKAGMLKEVRCVTLDACVDTGTWNLVINEEVRARLGLELDDSVFSAPSDSTTEKYAMTEPVEFCWKDRRFALPAQVIPTADEVLFGALPMESLNVMPNPAADVL